MNNFGVFANRVEAGRALAARLSDMELENPVVVALPRGGVPVALEVARTLKAPIDLVLVRKIGVPWQPELALGAVVNGGHPEVVLNEDVVKLAGISQDEIEEQIAVKLKEIERRRLLYLKDRPPAKIKDHTAIVVDDGIATGASVRAALKALQRRKPKKLVLAVPVASPDTIRDLRSEADEIVCLEMPEYFVAIGLYYRDFQQVADNDVVAMLAANDVVKPEAVETN